MEDQPQISFTEGRINTAPTKPREIFLMDLFYEKINKKDLYLPFTYIVKGIALLTFFRGACPNTESNTNIFHSAVCIILVKCLLTIKIFASTDISN